MSDSPINETILSQGSLVLNKNEPALSPSKSKKKEIDDHSNSLKQSVLDSYIHQKYSHINQQPKIKVFFFQFFGMVFFVSLALSTVVPKWADIYIGLGVLIGVIISGPVSGANLNPGVTLCNVLRKQNKFKLNMLPLYYFAQLAGALLAIVFTELIDDLKVGPLMPEDKDAVGCLRVVASQMFGTFILVFFILQISNPNTTFIDNELSGYMFIVFFVYTARKYAPSSHQCINSVIALSFATISFIEKGDAEGLLYCLLWIAGDFLGTIVAILFYEKLFQPNVDYMRKLRRDYQQRHFQSLLEEHSTIPERIEELDQQNNQN